MSAKLGLNAKLYWTDTVRASWGTADANGIHEGEDPGLVEVTIARDVTLNVEAGEADVSTRGNGGWEAVLAALRKASIDVQMVYDESDDNFLGFMAAWLEPHSIAVAMLDGAIGVNGTCGFWADFAVLKFTKEEPIDGAQMCTFTLKPTLSAVVPEMVRVLITP